MVPAPDLEDPRGTVDAQEVDVEEIRSGAHPALALADDAIEDVMLHRLEDGKHVGQPAANLGVLAGDAPR